MPTHEEQMVKVEKEVAGIFAFTDEKVDSDNPTVVNERLHKLASQLSRSAQLLADANELHSNALRIEMAKIDAKTSPTVLKLILESALSREQKLCDRAEKLNSTIVHQSDIFRTSVSFQKKVWGHDP